MLKHQVKYAINNSNLYITSDGLKSQAFQMTLLLVAMKTQIPPTYYTKK